MACSGAAHVESIELSARAVSVLWLSEMVAERLADILVSSDKLALAHCDGRLCRATVAYQYLHIHHGTASGCCHHLRPDPPAARRRNVTASAHEANDMTVWRGLDSGTRVTKSRDKGVTIARIALLAVHGCGRLLYRTLQCMMRRKAQIHPSMQVPPLCSGSRPMYVAAIPQAARCATPNRKFRIIPELLGSRAFPKWQMMPPSVASSTSISCAETNSKRCLGIERMKESHQSSMGH